VETITPRQAAEAFGVHYKTVMLWLRSGKIPGRKIGKTWLMSRKALEEFIAGKEPAR
jgi:excisionase family DNA binding protein